MRPISSMPCLLFMLILFQISSVSIAFGQCLDDQRSLLLELNNSLEYDTNFSTKLIQWNQNVDCCEWIGVECDTSGRVIGLDLDNEVIADIGNSTSLFGLQYLQKLNLANNSFKSSIPTGLRNLTNLARLNLSNAGFGGQVPVEIAEMRSLVMIDLSSQFQGLVPLILSNPNLQNFVQNLTALEELYLDGVNISSQGDWWGSLSSLPNLRNLSLRLCGLTGPLSSSFSQLQSLSVLRLDSNNLSTADPNVFADFRNLTILSLSFCSLQGAFPDSIFQVPSLQYLDLSNNRLLTGNVSGFHPSGSFRTITLSYSNFSGSLPNSIGNLRMLSMIDLSNCNFSGPIPSTIGNLVELVLLDLSVNNFSGPIPAFKMSNKLTYIDLNHNALSGSLSPTHFGGMSNLAYLNLGFNALNGSIPPSLFELHSLQKLLLSNNRFSGNVSEFQTVNSSLDTLDLSSNQLQGHIPGSVFLLERLNVLLLSFNSFDGTMNLERIQSLLNLTNLGLAYNNLSITSNSDLSMFPQLSRLNLASCNLSTFPNLINQTKLTLLDLSNNNIRGDIPSWIWKIGSGLLVQLNLSSNSLENLQMPYQIPLRLNVLDLHANKLQGNLPVSPASPIYVDYSSNNFQGHFPTEIGNFMAFASYFSVASNNLTGEIPMNLCDGIFLQVLDLSNNSLSGNIPRCLVQNLELGVLNLGGNNITGTIPDAFWAGCGLKTLDLRRNNLDGKIPASLANCTSLEVMNVGYNKINDTFPCILQSSSSLRVLVLRSNKFHGDIICHAATGVNHTWPHLQIIDIASNSFTGNLYRGCISSWIGMKLDNSERFAQNHLHFDVLQLNNNIYYQDTVIVTVKGLELELQKILTVFTSIDFSCNNFQGSIPNTIGELSSLYLLNLSRNSFTGEIPRSIGNLTELGSLDLSSNQLTGEIPGELISLTFLSFINVSNNNLSGTIPIGNQFGTFSAESYEGNIGLCGPPLNRTCLPGSKGQTETTLASSSVISFDLQFIFTGLGYGAGAALILAPLALSKKCRERCMVHQDRLLKLIYPGYGFSYIRCYGKVEAAENIEDDTTDDDDDDEDEDDGFMDTDDSSSGNYCVFCTKLDFQMNKAVHNPKCTCYFSPPTFSFSPTSSSSSSLLIVYQQKF